MTSKFFTEKYSLAELLSFGVVAYLFCTNFLGSFWQAAFFSRNPESYGTLWSLAGGDVQISLASMFIESFLYLWLLMAIGWRRQYAWKLALFMFAMPLIMLVLSSASNLPINLNYSAVVFQVLPMAFVLMALKSNTNRKN